MFSLTSLWWKGDPDEKDAILGMSRRDVYNVQKSWSTIYANAHDNSFLMFTRMFEEDPETQTFFKFLENASRQEMAQSVVFRAHLVNFMTALNATVNNLTTPEIAAELLRKIGHTHHQRHLRRKHFDVLRRVIVKILENDLSFSADVLVSWERFVEFMYQRIYETLTE